jgi:hypothetical protein
VVWSCVPRSIRSNNVINFGDFKTSPICRRSVRFNWPTLALSPELVTKGLLSPLLVRSDYMRAHDSFEPFVGCDDSLLVDYCLADNSICIHPSLRSKGARRLYPGSKRYHPEKANSKVFCFPDAPSTDGVKMPPWKKTSLSGFWPPF